LRALRAQVHTGRGQAVGIVGDPGIGKSRLLTALRQALADRALTYLEGRCLSYRQGTPLHLVRALLRQVCALPEEAPPAALTTQVHQCLQEMALDVADDAQYLLHLLGVPGAADGLLTLSPHALATRTLAIFLQLLLRKSQQVPLVIAVEDLHWIDATSEAWLTALVDQLAGAPVLLLGTYRPGYRPPWLDKSYATQLALQPLPPRDSRRIVHTIVGRDQVPAPLVQRLLARADRNPFVLEELAYTVLEHGAERAPWPMPETIQAVLTARIDHLPPTAKRVLHLAAVLGKDVPLALLEAMAALPPPTLLQGLQHLQAAEFLALTHLLPAPAYTFKHALTQEVAYTSLLPGTRQAYHQRLAEVLTTQCPDLGASQPELVAHHSMEAGLQAQAVGYWHQADQYAVQRSAHVEAIQHFTRGLEALAALPGTPAHTEHELRLRMALGASLMTTQGFASPEAADAYARAYELCQALGESPWLLPVLQGLWRWYFVRGELCQAQALAEQLLAVPQPQHDPARQIGGHNALGLSLFVRGELMPARTHLEHVLTHYDPQQPHTLAFLYGQDPGVVGLTHAAVVLWMLGYPEQAVQRSQEALSLARTLAHPFSLAFTLAQVAFLHQLRREYAEARALAEEVITLAATQGFPLLVAAGTIQQGWARVWQEHDAEGIAQMSQGIAAWRATGAALHLPRALATLAEAQAQAGRIEDGLTVLAEAFRLVEAHEERYYAAELHRLMGTLLLRRSIDHHAEAEPCFHQALAIARQQQARLLELRATVSLGRLWHQQGQHDAARRMLTEVCGWFTEGWDTVDLQEAKTLLEKLG
jgi:predicted ATPase